MNGEKNLIGQVKKNREQTIEVAWGEYQNHAYVYWRLNRLGEKPDPDKKGVCLRVDTVNQLIPLLQKAAQIAGERESELRAQEADFDYLVRQGGGSRRF